MTADLDERNDQLDRVLASNAGQLAVPGCAVGIWSAGAEHYAFHGITSIANPLPVDASTLFQAGSITKTLTATLIMRLAEAGRVDLSAPVRRYVPELRLRDRSAAQRVTVLQLLNHTAGFAGDLFWPGSDGEDALARHVALLADAGQFAAPGTAASYNNAAFGLAGRLIEHVTGESYEAAASALILAPLGMSDSYLLPAQVMTRRFAAGHRLTTNGPEVAPGWWAVPRRATPAGGLITTAADLIRYARFHLGDGTGADGTALLSPDSLKQMRLPTAALDSGYLGGHHVGIGWLLRDICGVALALHGGATNGQRATVQIVPERNFAIAVLTNSEVGGRLHREVVRWALAAYLGIDTPVLTPRAVDTADLAAYAGEYASAQVTMTVSADSGRLVLSPRIRDEALQEIPQPMRDAARTAGQDPGRLPPVTIRPADGDRFIIADGPEEGATGSFLRDADGQVSTLSHEGKLYRRVPPGGPARPGMQPDSLYELPVISDPRLSPDASLVAFTVTRPDRESGDYRSAIWIVPADGSAVPRRLTSGAGRDFSPRWSPDGSRLAFLSTRGGGTPQLYLLPADGGEAIAVTQLPGGAASPCWSPDGSALAFTSVVSDPSYNEPEHRRPPRRITRLGWRSDDGGYLCDRFSHVFVTSAAEASRPAQVTDGPFQDTSPAWSPDGSRLAFLSAREPDADRRRGNHLYVVAATGGPVTRLTYGEHNLSSPAWSPDGSQIACRYTDTDSWPRNGQIAVIDAASGEARVLTGELDVNCAPMTEQREPIWAGDDLVFPAEVRGSTHLYRVPADGSRPAEEILTGDCVISAHDLVHGLLVYARHTVTEPAELHAGARQLTRLTQSFRDATQLCPAERFEVTSDDGTAVDAWIMRPAGFRPGVSYPVLLFIHGGPFTQYRNGFFDEFQVAAGAGYAVVYSNPRGSSGYGESFARATAGPRGALDPDTRPDFRDLMAVMDTALDRFSFCDPERAGVLGGSFGGFMTAWIIGHTSRFRAACIERSVTDQLSQLGTSDTAGPWNDEDWGGEPYADACPILAHSPISYARAMQTPALILHAEHDVRAPAGQAEELFTALRTLGKEVEFVRFPAGNHDLSRTGPPPYRVARFDIILDWFDRYLKTPSRAIDRN